MSEEIPRIPCPNCGIYGEAADPRSSEWRCPGCGEGFFLRRCAACARVGYVDGNQGHRTPWPCSWCGQPNLEFRREGDPAAASAAALATEIGILGEGMLVQADPGAERPVASAPDADTLPGPGIMAAGDVIPFAAEGPPSAAVRKRRRGSVLAVVAALAVAACVIAVVTPVVGGHGPAGNRASGRPARSAAPGSAPASSPSQSAAPAPTGAGNGTLVSDLRPQSVQVTASQVRTADIQGVRGNLAIAGSGTGAGPVTLSGSLNWIGQPPAVRAALDHATGTLTVTITCAAGSPCAENLQLDVPSGTATSLRQSGGQITAENVAGPVSLITTGANITASGLRSPSLAAQLSSGQLTAAFSAPPTQVSVALDNAQATVRLPSSTGYQVTQQVSSGSADVKIPQASGTGHSIMARLQSSELELLPASS